ncbi:uncharacterized protein [Medicago truncatula]|uniref:uncharacterized protein n=1 Tax=Medicago truncatula TaxID=3880 RepID=UPI0000D5FB00|nr:uncharacterized protein LOC112419251 [Medicago truncatula]
MRLRDKGVNCPTRCVLCNSDDDEDSYHLFFKCPSSSNIWTMFDAFQSMSGVINQGQDSAGNIFNMLQVLNAGDAALFCCTLWSIWKQRNNKVWNELTDAQRFVFDRAKTLLDDWKTAKDFCQPTSNMQRPVQYPRWQKPLEGRFKCNIDASFSKHLNRVGIRICIRDDSGSFVLARTEWISPLCDVHVGEALGLLSALEWVHLLQLGPIDFELDAKRVVDSFLSAQHDATEFGSIIHRCKTLFNLFYENSSVEFIRRQANEVAHELAKAASSSASFQILVNIPECIEHILINEML